MTPPRVHAGCVGCGQTFEQVQAADRLCPRCRASSGLGAEEAADWRAFLAGVDAGLRSDALEAPVGDSPRVRGFRCGMAGRPPANLYGAVSLSASDPNRGDAVTPAV